MPAYGNQVAHLPQRDQAVLNPDPNPVAEKEKPLHFLRDSTLLRHENHHSNQENDQAHTDSGQEKGLPVLLDAQHQQRTNQQSDRKHQQHNANTSRVFTQQFFGPILAGNALSVNIGTE